MKELVSCECENQYTYSELDLAQVIAGNGDTAAMDIRELASPEPVEEYPTIEQGRDDRSERKSNGPTIVEAGLARPISFLAEGDGSQDSPERPTIAINTSVHSHLKRASRSNTRYDRYSAYQDTDGQEDSIDDTYLMNTDQTGNRKQVSHESV